MEKFKAIVSKVVLPDSVAVAALKNTLYVHSVFRDDLYRNPTTSLSDAIASSHNFIRMKEDTKALIGKLNASKAVTADKTGVKNADSRQEPATTLVGRQSNSKEEFRVCRRRRELPSVNNRRSRERMERLQPRNRRKATGFLRSSKFSAPRSREVVRLPQR